MVFFKNTLFTNELGSGFYLSQLFTNKYPKENYFHCVSCRKERGRGRRVVRSVGQMWQCFPLEFMMHVGAKEPSRKQACLTILGPHTFCQVSSTDLKTRRHSVSCFEWSQYFPSFNQRIFSSRTSVLTTCYQCFQKILIQLFIKKKNQCGNLKGKFTLPNKEEKRKKFTKIFTWYPTVRYSHVFPLPFRVQLKSGEFSSFLIWGFSP